MTHNPSRIPRCSYWFVLFLTVSSLAVGCATRGLVGQGTPALAVTDPVLDLYVLANQLKVGLTEKEVAQLIEPRLVRVSGTNFASRYPFSMLLPQSTAVSTEWRTVEVRANGWPDILFVFFKDHSKSSVIDALLVHSGQVTALIDGSFNQKLNAIKIGDSIDQAFIALGKRDVEYFRGEAGQWRVKLRYWGYRGRLHVIEADAASGKIISVYDGTI